MAITRFEDIEAWQMARKLSQNIYAMTFEGTLQKNFSLEDQILRASGSVMDQHHCSSVQFDELYEQVAHIRAKIGALVRYLENSTRRSPAPASQHITGNEERGTGN